MIQYFLECIAFQLIFLMIYEVFLKRETFFQWNRAYLLGTYLLSMILPGVKVDALGLNTPENYEVVTNGVLQLDTLILSPNTLVEEVPKLSLGLGILYLGMFVAALLFSIKLYTLYRLKQKGDRYYFLQFTRIIVAKSNLAFSFFNTIYLGDGVKEEDYDHIIAHELVHIRQRHSLDLLFFELMRIVSWFNPFVYLYQNRISELHEFIADTEMKGESKNAQYQLLLSWVFQTKNISFINPFFKSSLIKKRIVMLQKTKSKRALQLKYLLLLPIVFGMLCYTSMEAQQQISAVGISNSNGESDASFQQELDIIPFAVVQEVPVFPGCEDATDKRSCFNSKLKEHIKQNFDYPEIARESGIEGNVRTIFTIDKTGNIADIRSQQGSPEVLQKEVARILLRLPQMQPGKQKGKSVNVPFSMPISFNLHGAPFSLNIPERSKATKKTD